MSEHRIREIISERLAVDIKKVVDKARIVKDLGADSLDEVEVVIVIEDELGIEIPDEAAEKFKRVGDILKYLKDNHPSEMNVCGEHKDTEMFGIEIKGKFNLGISGEKKTKKVIDKYVNEIKQKLSEADLYYEIDNVVIVPIEDHRKSKRRSR